MSIFLKMLCLLNYIKKFCDLLVNVYLLSALFHIYGNRISSWLTCVHISVINNHVKDWYFRNDYFMHLHINESVTYFSVHFI